MLPVGECVRQARVDTRTWLQIVFDLCVDGQCVLHLLGDPCSCCSIGALHVKI
jgi:hypothetical protein